MCSLGLVAGMPGNTSARSYGRPTQMTVLRFWLMGNHEGALFVQAAAMRQSDRFSPYGIDALRQAMLVKLQCRSHGHALHLGLLTWMRGVGWQAGVLTVPWLGRLAFSRARQTAGGCGCSSAPRLSSAAMHTCTIAHSHTMQHCLAEEEGMTAMAPFLLRPEHSRWVPQTKLESAGHYLPPVCKCLLYMLAA